MRLLLVVTLQVFLPAMLCAKDIELPERIALYKAKAEAKDPNSMLVLGLMYASGEAEPVISKDEVMAARYFRSAAEQGEDFAQFKLAESFINGSGVVKSDVEAYKWLLLSASTGNSHAKERLILLEKQLTQSQRADGQARAELFKPVRPPLSEYSLLDKVDLAKREYKIGMAALNENEFFATAQQIVAAVPHFEISANSGNCDAQYMLSFLLNRDTPVQSPMSAIKWRLRAAYQGQPYAQISLASAYLYGNSGLDVNVVLALKWRIVADKSTSASPTMDWKKFDANLLMNSTDAERAEGKKLADHFFKILEN